MAQKKVYAVKRGRTTGLFASWEECRAQVDGFAGAAYRGFASPREATAWLFGAGAAMPLFDAEPPEADARETAAQEPTESAARAAFVVYTDGSCLKNPGGPGGYAAVILAPDGTVRELSGGAPETTNNRMELSAGIAALGALPEGAPVDFYTDSQYLKNAFTKYWLRSWKKRGWLTAAGTPVKNQDLWRALDEAIARRRVRFYWVKGHAGDRWNERCDALARESAARAGEGGSAR